jgi:NRPS condensation-like uncharacterized protein
MDCSFTVHFQSWQRDIYKFLSRSIDHIVQGERKKIKLPKRFLDSDLVIKRVFKYKIVHPFGINDVPIESMSKFEVTYQLSTLYKGIPYGPAHN